MSGILFQSFHTTASPGVKDTERAQTNVRRGVDVVVQEVDRTGDPE
jgi:hypothetical protein